MTEKDFFDLVNINDDDEQNEEQSNKCSSNDRTVCEVLLRIYFSKRRLIYLSEQLLKLIKAFLEHILMNDKLYGTNIAELIKIIYSEENYGNKDFLCKTTALSTAGLYRFRRKITAILSQYLTLLEFEDLELKFPAQK